MKNWHKYTASHVIGFRIFAAINIAAMVWAAFHGFSLGWWLIALAMYFVYGCLGVVVTFHRFLTHQSFKMPKWREYLFTIFGALGCTGSSIAWVGMHFAHHRHSDTELDPHSPKNGLLNMFLLDYRIQGMRSSNVRRLVKDPLHRFVHAYYHLILVGWGALLYLVGGLPVLLFVFMIPAGITAVMSNVTNLVGHKWGYQNYDTKDDSVNNPIAALLSFGEGWHNNHHRYPGLPNFGRKWWEFDLSWQVIKLVRSH